jgi:hypothetical protein
MNGVQTARAATIPADATRACLAGRRAVWSAPIRPPRHGKEIAMLPETLREALTFDDVLLAPAYSEVLPATSMCRRG